MQCTYAVGAGAPRWHPYVQFLARAQLEEEFAQRAPAPFAPFEQFEQFDLLPPPIARIHKALEQKERKLRVDFFAGGGGASHAMLEAFGEEPDLGVNHDADALNMHRANHPRTHHLEDDVFHVHPQRMTDGQRVQLFHASPDCTHHSQARAGQPRDRMIRSLTWVTLKWAGTVKPEVITLENVRQIRDWSPLVAKRDKATGRVVKIDGTVAAPGEYVPLKQQFLVPDERRKGECWRFFLSELRRMGYQVDDRILRACDFGAGTSRARLFMVARCDHKPIRWPKPTHGTAPGLKPFVTAADCIDWSIPCRSIFKRRRPLAKATKRRITRGIIHYVVNSPRPFIVPLTHTKGSARAHPSDEPLRTITTAKGGEFALCSPTLAAAPTANCEEEDSDASAADIPQQAEMYGATLIQTSYGERRGQAPRVPGIHKPLGTIVGTIKHRPVAAYLAKFRGESRGSSAHDPVPTITSGGAYKRPAGAAHALAVVEAQLGLYDGEASAAQESAAAPGEQRLRAPIISYAYSSNTAGGRGDVRLPAQTITTGGHHALVECELAQGIEHAALRVAKFLIENGGTQYASKEIDKLSIEQLLAIVSVYIEGVRYLIIDIGLRMLTPRELFTAQGFPRDYIIDVGANGKPLSQSTQVRMVGNSVSPPPYRALLEANFGSAQFSQALAA